MHLPAQPGAAEPGYRLDDQDHFANRRIRSVGELIQNQVRIGLSRMERVVRERMTTQDVEAITPQTLINIRPVVAAIKEFFGTSQLSQFMDQVNPLSGLTHRRRLSALGPGGLSRERAGFEVRDVHFSHYGRMCPIETPEGPNIGLIGGLATFAKVNEFGFIESPYRKVIDGTVTDEIVYLTADEEEEYVVAQANAPIDETASSSTTASWCASRRRPPRLGELKLSSSATSSSVPPPRSPRCRRRGPAHGRLAQADRLGGHRAHPVPRARRRQPGAHGRQHAAPGRAAGAGRGALHRHRHRGPRARDAADMIIADDDGVTSSRSTARRSPSSTRGPQGLQPAQVRALQPGHLHQPAAPSWRGDKVKPGDVLADGPSTDNGELALGKNLLVAFMPWEGYNFEDAIILSERLVRDDVLTSIHIHEHEIDARDTKLGPEEITRDIPNLSEDILADLDERGIIRIGAEVGPGDVLVGKVTPKGETELTPEERLLRAIFGEKAREVRDTSLKVPHGENGKVIDVKVVQPRRRPRAAAGREPARAGLRRPEAQDQRGRQARRPPRQQGRHLQDPARSRTCPSWPTAPPSTSSSTPSASRPA
jgi:DNA-directed RNA polymerase subunit beta